jgi:hypothetical protein
VQRIVKRGMCKFWLRNLCFAGHLCRHAHSVEELPSPELSVLMSVSSNPSQSLR